MTQLMMIAAAGPARPFPWMWIAIAVGCAVIAAVLAWILSASHQKKVFEETVGTAEVKSREIIDEAIKTAAEKKREALLEAKEENLAARNDLERETKERRAELQRTERRLQNKEESLDKKIESLKCHTSEYNKFGAEDWIEGVRCRCGFRGYEIGKKFAEAFEILRLELSFDERASL